MNPSIWFTFHIILLFYKIADLMIFLSIDYNQPFAFLSLSDVTTYLEFQSPRDLA